jgi:hypothetical protein
MSYSAQREAIQKPTASYVFSWDLELDAFEGVLSSTDLVEDYESRALFGEGSP